MRPTLSASRKEKGIAILLTGVLLVLIIPIVGLAIDAGVLYALKAKLVLATDAAALAAARSLNLGLTLAAQEAAATSRAVTVYNANFPANAFYTKNNTISASVAENSYKTRTVTVSAQLDAPTYFMRFLGFDHTTVKASGTASRRDVNLVLVLDRSSSMSNANSCAVMKADAVQFVNMFSEGRDTIGLITFGSSIYTGFQPSKNFKTVLAPNTDTLPNLINQIQCGGNTSSAMALNAAYNMIKTINQSGALNVILFFTDGYPNGVTGFYPIKTASDTRYGYSGGYNPTKASPDGTYNTTKVCDNKNSTCTMDPSPCKDTGGDMYDRNSGQTKRTVFGPPWNVNWNTNTIAVGTGAPAGTIRGVYAQWAGDLYNLTQGESNGLMKEAATSISQTSEPYITTGVAGGCAYNGGGSSGSGGYGARRDFAYIPDADVFGNSTAGFKTPALIASGPYVGKKAMDCPMCITGASFNAADNQATTIRNDDTYKTVIFTIGLGGNGEVDHTFLKRVSNDALSPIYDNTRAMGLYEYSPTPAELAGAFNRIASEILRLAL